MTGLLVGRVMAVVTWESITAVVELKSIAGRTTAGGRRVLLIVSRETKIVSCCMVTHIARLWINPGKVANPARRQLNRKNEYFPVCVCAWKFGLARRVRQSRPASAYSYPYSGWIWCLLTGFLPISAAASISLFKLPYAIGSVPSLSGHASAYRWRSLPRVHRHRASSPQGSSSDGCCHFAGHRGPINMPLSFPHPLIVWDGHVESILQLGKNSTFRFVWSFSGTGPWNVPRFFICHSINSWVWTNRVRLPIRHGVNWTGKTIFPLYPFAPESWSRETGSAVPYRFSLLILHTRSESGDYSRDFSCFTRCCLLVIA